MDNLLNLWFDLGDKNIIYTSLQPTEKYGPKDFELANEIKGIENYYSEMQDSSESYESNDDTDESDEEFDAEQFINSPEVLNQPEIFCVSEISNWTLGKCSNSTCSKLHTKAISTVPMSQSASELGSNTKIKGDTTNESQQTKAAKNLKQRAFSRTMMDTMKYGSCNSECKYGGKCVKQTTNEEMMEETENLWGNVKDPSPLPSARKIKIKEIFR